MSRIGPESTSSPAPDHSRIVRRPTLSCLATCRIEHPASSSSMIRFASPASCPSLEGLPALPRRPDIPVCVPLSEVSKPHPLVLVQHPSRARKEDFLQMKHRDGRRSDAARSYKIIDSSPFGFLFGFR